MRLWTDAFRQKLTPIVLALASGMGWASDSLGYQAQVTVEDGAEPGPPPFAVPVVEAAPDPLPLQPAAEQPAAEQPARPLSSRGSRVEANEPAVLEAPPIELIPDDQPEPQESTAAPESAMPLTKNAAPGESEREDAETLDDAALETSAPESDAVLLGDKQLTDVNAVVFNGVQPGQSTVVDLKEAWGEPAQVIDDPEGEIYIYSVPPFRGIEVVIDKNVVQSIIVHLEDPLATEVLVDKLKLGDFRPVEVLDAEGGRLGQAFPERGVLFHYATGTPQLSVRDILLDPIDVQPFVQRAASQLQGPYRDNLADLRYAVELDPQHAQAHWLQAQILLALGRTREANDAMRMALRLEPHNKTYRLTWAECLEHQLQYDKAEREIRRALGDGTGELPPLVQAQAQLQLARIAAAGAQSDYRRAAELYQEAIKRAEPLADASQLAVRRQAWQILVEAHLGLAHSIGWGNWNRKNEVVPKWLSRAEQLATEAIAGQMAGPELNLRVIEGTFAAHSGFASSFEPDALLRRADTITQQLSQTYNDPLWDEHLEWRLGSIYRRAMQIEHSRAQAANCIKYGERAREMLETAALGRQESLAAREELGRLYFGLGAVRAIHQQDHETAIFWYDKAAALFTPLADEEGSSDPTLGDALVSMGVSYWQIEMRQKGVDITSLGAKVLERAVGRGGTPSSVMNVPYGNLASMYHALGDQQQAQTFARLATQNAEVAQSPEQGKAERR